MRVSLNTIKQFTDVTLSLDELTAKINSQLGAIEEVVDLADKYKDAVIVKVVECEKHPAADRLNVTKVDDGGTIKDVERDENGYVQVVCGAPNVHADMFAVWLPPRSVVPATYDHDEPFVLGARELRGIMSQGMLAAADELGIGNDHDGILELKPDEWKPNDVAIEPGVSFAVAYGLDDTIIDIENKMFTHRPDLFGQLGVAREIAGIQHKKFVSPEWYTNVPEFESANELELVVKNEADDMVPRFMATAIKGIEVKPSPLWLQCALVALGSKPINNIVDVTNYVMLLTAQPTHAYDYDKVRGHELTARMAKDGEKAELLNGKTYELTENDIVIADSEGAIGLAGIMGGGNSEVSSETKNIVLEVGNFDMYNLRKSSMRHGVFTDALTRFNKGQSALQNNYIMDLLIKSILDVSPGKHASDVFDSSADSDDSVHEEGYDVTVDFINQRLGLSLTDDEIIELLSNVEIAGAKRLYADEPDRLEFTVPFWRTDLFDPEDFVEEVGRLYGFDGLPRVLPTRSTKPTAQNPLRELKRQIRETLSKAGANEVLTYSFVHEKVIKNAGQDPAHAFKLSNALSPDLQYYRLSLTPSLLDKVHMNYKAGHQSFALFELGRTHFKGEMDSSEPTVPNEDSHLAFVVASKQTVAGAAYYTALRYLEEVVATDGYEFMPLANFDTTSDEWGAQLVAAYEPARSAVLVKDKQVWGVVGEFKASVRKAFKLPDYAAGFEIHLDAAKIKKQVYQPLSKFPSVTQDISLRVSTDTPYKNLWDIVGTELNKADDIKIEVTPVTVYQSNSDMQQKTITFRVRATSYQRTLQDADVSKILDRVAQISKDSIGAERI